MEQKRNILKERKNDIPPSQTLYVRNLNERIKLEELKTALFQLFTQYGDVLEIHSKKNLRMKGQAFIIFKELTAASEAMRSLQGTNFFGKLLDIHYSKIKSDVVAESEGTFDPNERKKRRIRREEEMQKLHEERKKKTENNENAENPNSILFVEGLIVDVTSSMLSSLFGNYPGLKEVRLIPGKQIAFVEYTDETQAGVALIGMNGFKLSNDCILKVSFSKK